MDGVTGASYSSETLSFTMPSDANAGGVVLTAHFTADEHEHEFVEVKDTRIEPTCLEYGTVKVKCTICGEIIEETTYALGHDWDEGTTYSDAIVYTCKRCGYIRKSAQNRAHATPTSWSARQWPPAVTQTPEPVVTPVR